MRREFLVDDRHFVHAAILLGEHPSGHQRRAESLEIIWPTQSIEADVRSFGRWPGKPIPPIEKSPESGLILDGAAEITPGIIRARSTKVSKRFWLAASEYPMYAGSIVRTTICSGSNPGSMDLRLCRLRKNSPAPISS